MSKGPKTITTTNQTTVDPRLTQRQNDLWSRGTALADQPYQPYTGERFAGFTPDQIDAWTKAREAAGAGQSELNQAGAGLDLLSSFDPGSVTFGPAGTYTAGGGGRVTAQSAAGRVAGTPGYTPISLTAQQVSAKSFPDANLDQYLNPHTQAVVDTSLSDVERARKEAIAAGEARAAATGAWGGKRHGVADSLTNREFGSIAARTAAELRSQGFDKAAGLITSDNDRALAAGQSNQAAGLQAGIANQSSGLQAGLASQRNLLDAVLSDQRAGLEADLANQADARSTSQFNASARQASDQFNASGRLSADTTTASNRLAGANTRLNALNALSALGGQRQQMLGQGADLLSRIGGQQQSFNQAKRDFDYQQFTEGRDRPYQNLDLLSRLLASGQYGSTTTSTAPNPNRGSFLGNALGLGGLLAGGPLGGLLGKGVSSLLGGGGKSYLDGAVAGGLLDFEPRVR